MGTRCKWFTTLVTHKEPMIINVDINKDEKDQDLLPSSSPVTLSPVEGYDLHRQYITCEGGYDENYVFGDDSTFDEFLGEEVEVKDRVCLICLFPIVYRLMSSQIY